MYQVNFSSYYVCVPKEAWGGLHVLIEVTSQGVTAHDLTGVSPGGGTGATMSDGEDDYDSDYEANYLDPHDSGGFGPLVPTESERTLMERVRQELKYELKQVNLSTLPLDRWANVSDLVYRISAMERTYLFASGLPSNCKHLGT